MMYHDPSHFETTCIHAELEKNSIKGLVVVTVEWPMNIEQPKELLYSSAIAIVSSTRHISTAIVVVELENVPCFLQTH